MQNRVILITGASSGIGAACARLLGDTSRLALVARRRELLEEQVARVEDAGGEAVAISADLTRPDDCARAVAVCVARFGCLDAVINNAGVFATGPAAATDDGDSKRMWQLNVRAPMLVVRAALPHLRAQGGGWIVNVSSAAVEASFAGCAVYTASKAALEAWSRILREELRAEHIRVGVVVPGATDTPAFPAADAAMRARMCRPEDVARAIAFLLATPPSASVDRLVLTPPGGAL